MHKYTFLFSASGQAEVEAENHDKLLDIIHDHFKGIGVNATKTRIIAIDGKPMSMNANY